MNYVYRSFDEAGRLLYIGCSNDVARRMAQHNKAVWRPYHAKLTSQAYGDRQTALAAEAAAIAAEHPFFNAQPEHTAMVQANRIEATRLLDLILPDAERDEEWYIAREAIRYLIRDTFPLVDDTARLEFYLSVRAEAAA